MDKREEDSRCQWTQATARLLIEPVTKLQKTGTGKTFWKGKEKGLFRQSGRTSQSEHLQRWFQILRSARTQMGISI